jgi:hypothetical protein
MAWDASRPIPWRRLLREAIIFLIIAVVVFALLDRTDAGTYAGLLLGAAMFVGFSALMVKFGYERQTLKQLRSQAPPSKRRASSSTTTVVSRERPAPTRRTSTGPSQRPGRRKR